MSYIKKINRKLEKAFNAKVAAREDSGRLILSGELPRWEDVVRAGEMAVDKNRYSGLVNDITCTGAKASPMRIPGIKDNSLNGEAPDVLIIGGGITGCAIARELSRYKINVLLVEKEHDLAMHASGRNDGVVHSGIDLKRGTLKYNYNRAGNRMYDQICADLGVEFDRCGQYLCFGRAMPRLVLYLTLPYWKWSGLNKVKVVSRKKLRKREPGISRRIGSALYFPGTGVVCPYNLTIAYAENAVSNGVTVSLDTAVLGIDSEDGIIRSVTTNRGKVFPKIVVNAAGVFCEDIAGLAGDRFYSIHPRKGTNVILDKKYSDIIVNTTISSFLTVSTKKAHSKGGGVIRTVGGNTLVGPDAVETIEKEDFSTTWQSVASTMQRQGLTCSTLAENQIITYFSGIRASTYEEDFVVCKGIAARNMVHAAGIQSPGLTAAPAIGVDAAQMVMELLGQSAKEALNDSFDPVRRAYVRTAKLDDNTRANLIARNPDYGVIICRCEEVSKGEVLDALRRDIPCDTLDGVKRRVRPGMGRCQGGFCGPLVLDIIAKEKRQTPGDVSKNGEGSELLLGHTKQVHVGEV